MENDLKKEFEDKTRKVIGKETQSITMEEAIIVSKEDKIILNFLDTQLEFEKEHLAQLKIQNQDNGDTAYIYEEIKVVNSHIAYLEELLLRRRNGF